MKEHNDYVLELPNFVPEQFCNHLITKFENTPTPRLGTVQYEGNSLYKPNTKNTLEHCLCCTPGFEEEYDTYMKFLKKAVELYLYTLKNEYEYDQEMHLFTRILSKRLSGKIEPVIQKIVNGVENKWHYDGGIPSTNFIVTILYLNTLKPEEGGCTEVGPNGRKIKPECGKIAILPASWTYPHRGCKVFDTDKYIVSCLVDIEMN